MAGECRVVINTFYREPTTETEIYAEIESRAAQHGVKEVIYVSKAGNMRHFVSK